MSKRAHQHIIEISADRYAGLYELVSANGVISLEKSTERGLFDFLANVVVNQQLSNSAARTIFTRFEQAAAEAGLSLVDFVSQQHSTRIASCGLSQNKVKALFALKAAFSTGELSEDEDLPPSYNHISRKITSIWGLGQWSADMAAIFYYGLPDVWSGGDMSLRRGISALTGATPDESLDIASDFAPYKSFLALHIWKGVDDGLL